jgi:hypothetical protein
VGVHGVVECARQAREVGYREQCGVVKKDHHAVVIALGNHAGLASGRGLSHPGGSFIAVNDIKGDRQRSDECVPFPAASQG